MDKNKKTIEVNAGSLIDLKAELFRKQEEIRQRKLQDASLDARTTKPIGSKKLSLLSKKNIHVLEKVQDDLVQKAEEVDVLEQSKKALASKVAIYEKLNKGDFIPEEDGSQVYLVDFQQKAIETISNKRRIHLEAKTEENSSHAEGTEKKEREAHSMTRDNESPAPHPDEEWVDYVDSLGRSRKCMKKDLSGLMEMDRKLTGKRAQQPVADTKLDLLSSDMKRELQRQEWEKEAQMALEKPVGPVHYSNIQFKEVRDHGVGFYGFAKDEETRQQQMDALKELREQTRTQRERHGRLKEKRKQILEERLNKVKQRRIIKDTLEHIDLDPMAFEDSELKNVEKEDSVIKEDIKPEPLVRDDSWRKTAPVRDWDKHKKPVFDEESWLDKQRSERIVDFAPPSFYENQHKPPLQNTRRSNFQRPKVSSSEKMQTNSFEEKFSKTNSFHELSFSDNYATVTDDRISTMVERLVSSIRHDQSKVKQDDSNAFLEPDVSSIPLPGSSNMGKASSETVNTIDDDARSYVGVNINDFFAGQIPQQIVSNQSHWPQVSLEAAQMYYGNFFTEVKSNCVESVEQSHALDPFSPVVETCEIHSQANETVCSGSEPKTDQVFAAPQPAHYSSLPMKPQPKAPKYEVIRLHELPLTLPQPPSAKSVPHYPSQEELVGLKKSGNHKKNEQAMIRDWFRQFDQKPRSTGEAETGSKPPSSSNVTLLKPTSIPFASPYIQKKEGESKDESAAMLFDPAKPPPSFDSNTGT